MTRCARRGLQWAAGVVGVLCLPGVGRALSTPNDFCTGDPCVIAADATVDAGAVLDFGTRTVILQKMLTIADLPTGGVGSLTLRAGTLRITGDGVIRGQSSVASGGTVMIEAVSGIQIDGTTTLGSVRLMGQDAGSLTLHTTAGPVTGSGRINLGGDGIIASGGTLVIASAADINYTGRIEAPGGTQGEGGDFTITAAGNASLTGFIDLTGGESGAGYLDVTTGGNLTLGEVDMSANGDAGDAGIASFVAGGNITFSQRYRGRGADNGENCGDGADIDVTAGGDVTLAAEYDIRGRGLDCTGGFLSIDAGNVYLQDQLLMSGTGTESDGGDLDVSATGLIRQTGTVWLDGGDSGAGDLLYVADGSAEILGPINAYGRTATSAGSSLLEIDGTVVTVASTINANAGSPTLLNGGGDITLDGCDVITQSTANITATGDTGTIAITASDSALLRGLFTAGSNGGIDLQLSTKANPPNTAGAVFSPAPTVAVSPLIVPCRVCDTSAQCADGNDCTDDVCVPASGCTHTPRNSGPCSDGNACSVNDQCVAGTCVSGPPATCDDHNPCTLDACFTSIGCLSFPVAGSCDDGDACTTGDTCTSSGCAGTPINCNDGNPCTTDSCGGGVCSHANNTNPCNDGDACTSNDVCSGGVCTPGPPTNCSDGNVCTTDSCNAASGCQHAPVVGCVDTDHDGKIDDQDECTTIVWTPQPQTPPNQNPRKFALTAGKLSVPDGAQTVSIKGAFNMAPSPVPLDPATYGVHIYAEDALGAIFDVSVPGGAGCGPDDGWHVLGTGLTRTWKYGNKSGALPPGCAAGSAAGVASVQIKDRRVTSAQALQFKIRAKDATLLRDPVLPLTRVQVSFALGARPSPGTVSAQAKAGECAEALFTGNPIATAGRPSCKATQKNAQLDAVKCRGL